MKLYNKTKCPDEILQPLLIAAGKSVGTRTGKVVVKVTQSHYYGMKGVAYQCPLVYSWHLKRLKHYRTRNKYIHNSGRLIQTDGGYIQISLPAKGRGLPNTIDRAESFYRMAQHEWAHINDYQSGNYKQTPRTLRGRRIRWEDRPCEIAAMNSVNDAKKIQNVHLLILKLAEYLKP